ncbi:MAG TPA: hypothetical protein VGL59_07760, partial [Polyangia bacterium]|jgi:hypothetical protein
MSLIPKYPLFLPLLMVPFFALAPGLVFLPGVLAGIALAWMAGRILESWGKSRLWGLIILLDPTVALLSRTVMSDVPLALFGLCTWYHLRRGAGWQTTLFAALAVIIRVNGVVTVGALLAGQSLVLLRDRRRPMAVLRAMTPLLLGMSIGGAVLIGLNLLANGTVHSGYNESASQAFGLRFLATSGRAHLKSLLLCPPLLVLGAWPYWRRRDFAALFASLASILMMIVYFFVDWGVGFIDTLVLSRRLILPSVVFLLVGYADILAQVFRGFRWVRVGQAAAVVLPALLALALGHKHRQWQMPAHRALVRAEMRAKRIDSDELGVTPSAFKIGLLFPGRTVFVARDRGQPKLVLCHSAEGSYRMRGVSYSCALPGYRVAEAMAEDDYYLLERTGAPN